MAELSVVDTRIRLAVAFALFTFMRISRSGKGPWFIVVQGLTLLTIDSLRIVFAFARTGSKIERDMSNNHIRA